MFEFISVLFVLSAWLSPQADHKPSWQTKETNCNESMTLCWYQAEQVSDPEVIAFGQRWNTQDKDEKPLEWVTEVRCMREKHMCILAQSKHVLGIARTTIDLFVVEEWTDFQIRALGENDYPKGQECEIDSLILNRSEGSVSLLTVPGPAASTKHCVTVMKPKTVMYTLDLKTM
jgi:hypothetical protein